MPQHTAPNLGLAFGWNLGESGWNTGMDANMKKLDAVVNCAVLNIANAPASTADGARYVVGTSPTGDFAGQANRLAVRIEGVWNFYAPAVGWAVYNIANGLTYRYTQSGWIVPPVIIPAQPFLEVSDPGAWTFDNTAWRKIPLNTVNTDTAGGWDASNNTDYIIPQAGLYLVEGIVRPLRSGAGALPDDTAFAAGVGITAADGDDVAWQVSPSVASALFTVSINAVRRYAVGDKVSIFAKHAASSAVALSRVRFRVLRLSD